MGANLTAETLELMKAAQAASSDAIVKNFTQPTGATTGLQAYNLEAPSKKLYPVMTPLRNRIARVSGGYATQANWKAITGINTTNVRAGVSEGNRGGQVQHAMKEYFAAFRGIGLEKSVTFEADYAGRGFEDVKALAVMQTLQSLMVQEEMILLGGNTSLALGKTPTPALVTAAQPGAKLSGSISVICVALGLQAYWDVAGANNGAAGQELNVATAQVPGQITRTNADGSTDTFGGGSAQASDAATVSANANQKIVASLPQAVRGAYAYAWFWGAAGQEKLGAVTTTASVEIAADALGTQKADGLKSDNSTSALEFDGLLTQIAKADSGAFYADNAGKLLTSDDAGGILELEAAFVDFYNKYRLSPQTIYISAKDLVGMTKLVLGSKAGAPLLSLSVDVSNAAAIRAGVKLGSFLNKVTGDEVDVVVHPNLPTGTLLFYSERIPAYLDGVSSLLRVLTRQEYYQIEWPLRTRKYEYGVYADEVLQGYFMPAFGVLTNIRTA